MKEFNSWFTIAFSFKGNDFEKTINIKSLDIPITENDTREWRYYTDINVGGESYDVVVYGTYDDDGNIRTSGECYVNGEEVCPAFGIEVYDSNDNEFDISDIDIIDGD